MQGGNTEIALAHRAARGAVWTFVSSGWQFGLGFIATVMLTRLLFPSQFGEFALAAFFAQLLRVQSKISAGHAFVQNQELTGETLGTFCLTEAAAALAGVILTVLAAPLLPLFGYSRTVAQISIVLSLTFFLEGLGGMASIILSRELRFMEVSVLNIALFPLSYVPAFWLATHGGGVWSLVAQGLTYNLLMLPLAWLTARARLPHIFRLDWRFVPGLCRLFLKFGATVGLAALAGVFIAQMDNWLIGTFVGVAVLGLYDRAYRIAEWPGALFNKLIANSIFYMYSKLQNDRARLERTVEMVMWGTLSFTLPAAFALFVTAPDLLVLLYGNRWAGAALFLRILIVYSVVRPLWENAGTFFIATGKPIVTTKCNWIQATVLVMTGLPLTLLWGAVGTCVAVGLAFGTGMAILFRRLISEVSISPGRLFASPMLAALLASLSYLAFNYFARLQDLQILPRLLLRASWAILSFSAATILVQPSTVREKVLYIYRLLTGKQVTEKGGVL